MFSELLIKGYSARAQRRRIRLRNALFFKRRKRRRSAETRQKGDDDIKSAARVSFWGISEKVENRQTSEKTNSFKVTLSLLVLLPLLLLLLLLFVCFSRCTLLRERERRDTQRERETERERQRENTPHQNSLPSSLKSKFGKRCPTTRK